MEFPPETCVASSNTDFCLQVAYSVLLKQLEKGSNFVCSPLSLHIILSLVAAGSTGSTLLQLRSVLGLQQRPHDLHLFPSQIMSVIRLLDGNQSLNAGAPILSFVNGAWVEQTFGLKSSFEEVVKQVYRSHVNAVDFLNQADRVRDEVNVWAENATNGLIRELLPSDSLDNYTKLVFANALYFKGAWDNKFDPSMTKTKSFYLINGQIVQVPFMTTMIYQEYYYGSFENITILKIPYQSGDKPLKFAMYFFLPHENDGLPNLIHLLNSNPGFINQDFGLQREEISEFWIPRFKFLSDFEAKESMVGLGLTLPFREGELTEVSDSIWSRKLYVSEIFHKAFIEVNEEGTEAAACTAAVFKAQCLKFPIPRFVADHPFIFMVREETSMAVFFLGAVLNPLLTS